MLDFRHIPSVEEPKRPQPTRSSRRTSLVRHADVELLEHLWNLSEELDDDCTEWACILSFLAGVATCAIANWIIPNIL